MAGASRSQEPERHCSRLVHIRIASTSHLTIALAPECPPQCDRRADRFASTPLWPLSIAAWLG